MSYRVDCLASLFFFSVLHNPLGILLILLRLPLLLIVSFLLLALLILLHLHLHFYLSFPSSSLRSSSSYIPPFFRHPPFLLLVLLLHLHPFFLFVTCLLPLPSSSSNTCLLVFFLVAFDVLPLPWHPPLLYSPLCCLLCSILFDSLFTPPTASSCILLPL